MTDDRELAGLDPFALLDRETGRLDAFLSGLGIRLETGIAVRWVDGTGRARAPGRGQGLPPGLPGRDSRGLSRRFAERGGTDMDW